MPLDWISLALTVVVLLVLVLLWRATLAQRGAAPDDRLLRPLRDDTERNTRELRDEVARSATTTRQELATSLGTFQQTLLAQQGDVARTQNEQIDSFRTQLAATQ